MARRKSAPDDAKDVAAAPVAPVERAAEVAPVATLNRKDLVERVRAASGAKKKDVRTIVEATLLAMGEALSRGEVLHLPPFGVARVTRGLDGGAGKSLVIKLRRGKADATANETLAEPAEAD